MFASKNRMGAINFDVKIKIGKGVDANSVRRLNGAPLMLRVIPQQELDRLFALIGAEPAGIGIDAKRLTVSFGLKVGRHVSREITRS